MVGKRKGLVMDMDLQQENKRLAECLRKANAQAEHFEREWYLRGDALEAAAQSLDTIARLAGKDEYLKTLMDVRLYAASRARVAEAALKDAPEDQKAQARDRDFARGYYCAVAALLAMDGAASTQVTELARMGGNMAHADAEDLERLRAAGLAG